ncbi:adenine phosphoribosyltransferase [Treponema ruminis]|uniref:Adenine phosphoribosyltransferase n=1 Tax=Treponema ruminis TaxID=744515 RepID=A0A7W8LLY2_9SPIR|nr:adenine phosphoribosyltransferase [Treponema ruminis]MBB5225947.1 adenine phosphoribosyltransferase [Treponema ruminis]QSI03141.1 adenine phosphoribosyltransferase [Treponema ruminis]
MNKDEILDKAIRRVPDFPKPGILFFDVTSILTNPPAFKHTIDRMVEIYSAKKPDAIAAVESRGFLFGAPLAEKLGIPLVLIRKKGKLPGEVYSASYALEYGEATIEAHKADIEKGKSYLVIDDLIATGGTLNASKNLIEQGGGKVLEFFGVIGIPELNYEKALSPVPVTTLIDLSEK